MIECMDFRSYESGTLLGFANLFVEEMGLEIYGCSLHEKEGRKWINLPSREYKDENGDKKYSNIVRFREKSRWTNFIESACKCVEEWISANMDEHGAVTAAEPQSDGIPF